MTMSAAAPPIIKLDTTIIIAPKEKEMAIKIKFKVLVSGRGLAWLHL